MVRTVDTNHFYEILAQISDPKIEVSTKTYSLKNMTSSEFLRRCLWCKKTLRVVPQQNKGCKHIPEHSRPNSDQITSKNLYFYNKFIENRWFLIKITKKIKIVAKALLRIVQPGQKSVYHGEEHGEDVDKERQQDQDGNDLS